ncbi:MAG: tripartite tricarboxylate transporter substrate binding protein [Betaproteobacteria bacterium]
MQFRNLIRGALMGGCGLLAGTSVALGADAYPQRAVRMIIPYPPGGAGDIVGRLISTPLAQSLGQQIVIDNRGGGAQLIATEMAAKAPADGYTLFLASATHSINPGLQKKLPYDTIKDFASITMVASSPLVFVANPSLGVAGIKDLVAAAKAQPGRIAYASSGPGTGGHLAVELLSWMAGIKFTHIPYKGAAPALIDVIGGQVQFMCTSPLPAMPHVKSGKLRALAMTGAKRSPSAPDIPTVAEAGYKGYETGLWYALLAPVGTPRTIIAKLHDATVKVVKSAGVTEQLSTQGAEPVGNTPQELDAYIKAEIERWTRVISQAQIRPD